MRSGYWIIVGVAAVALAYVLVNQLEQTQPETLKEIPADETQTQSDLIDETAEGETGDITSFETGSPEDLSALDELFGTEDLEFEQQSVEELAELQPEPKKEPSVRRSKSATERYRERSRRSPRRKPESAPKKEKMERPRVIVGRTAEAPYLQIPRLEPELSEDDIRDTVQTGVETRVETKSGVQESRLTAVSHEEWAWQLVDSLGLQKGIPPDPTAQDAFSLLNGSPKNTLSFHSAGNGFRQSQDMPCSEKTVSPEGKPLFFPRNKLLSDVINIDIPASGFYQLRVISKNGMSKWFINEEEKEFFSTKESLVRSESNRLYLLARGGHQVRANVEPGVRVECMELVPVETPVIRPSGGWAENKTLTFGDKALTMLQAMGMGNDLPPVGLPHVIEAEKALLNNARPFADASASEGTVVRAMAPASMLFSPEVREEGLYSVLVRGIQVEGSSWSLNDGVRQTVPRQIKTDGYGWWEIGTYYMDEGGHAIRGDLPRSTRIDALRMVHRSESPESALSLLKGIGFSEGMASEAVDHASAGRNLKTPAYLATTQGRAAAAIAGTVVAAAAFYVADPLDLRENDRDSGPPSTPVVDEETGEPDGGGELSPP